MINENKLTVNEAESEYDEELNVNKKKKGAKQMMMLTPGLAQRVKLYLKPIQSNYCIPLVGLLLDTVMSWVFIFAHVWYIFFAEYDHSTDKLMLAIIGPCFTGAFWIYSIGDAIRFLPRWYDKILYVFSCIL